MYGIWTGGRLLGLQGRAAVEPVQHLPRKKSPPSSHFEAKITRRTKLYVIFSVQRAMNLLIVLLLWIPSNQFS